MFINLNIFIHVLVPFFIAMMACEKQLREKEDLWLLFAILLFSQFKEIQSIKQGIAIAES